MENMIAKLFSVTGIKFLKCHSRQCLTSQRLYSTSPRMKKVKMPHPYRNIHPWKSLEAFSKSLVAGVIHNEDGLVAINKPYGISGGTRPMKEKKASRIVNEVEYTLHEATPYIASAFGYPTLKLIKTPEKFTSGVAMFATNDKIHKAVEESLNRALGMGILPKTYWIVTTRVSHEIRGEMRLAMKMQKDPTNTYLQPIIITSWTRQAAKNHDIKILNVQFNTISNSTGNLASLIQIKSSTARWHALRVFAASVLFSPILGDNKYGSRVKKVLGKWTNISPFVDAAREPPKLDGELLRLLRLSPGKEMLIPTHTHLREVFLPKFLSKDRDLILTAPPMPEFTWTCRQLEFKHELFEIDRTAEMTMKEHAEAERYQAVT